MNEQGQDMIAIREARGFAVTETSDIMFFDVKAAIAADYARQLLLPAAKPNRTDRIMRMVSMAAGPLLLIAAYAGVARLIF